MKCKLCGRKITAKLSKERGYGAVCWEKVQNEKQPTNNQYEERIAKLELLIEALERKVFSHSIATPNSAPTQPTSTAILIHTPEYSISELSSHPLFLRQQRICAEA